MPTQTMIWCFQEKFVTRRFELQQRKPSKEIVLDQNALTIKDKQLEHSCSTRYELELFQAMRRRALTFDLVGLCRYEIFNAYHSELLQHLQEELPPGYTKTSLVQILRADRSAFMHIAETISTLKRDAAGELPLERHPPIVLSRPAVTFHLLPLASAATAAKPLKNAPTKRKAEDSPDDPGRPAPRKGKGKGKTKSKKRGRGPNVPKELIGKALEGPNGQRICWPYNMSSGCKDAPPGGKCSRGLHICAEPGC